MNDKDARAAAEQITQRFQVLHEKIIYLERVAGVLRASNAHRLKKLDKALAQRDIYRDMHDQASRKLEKANRRLLDLGQEPVLFL